jgi:hypothetical protein
MGSDSKFLGVTWEGNQGRLSASIPLAGGFAPDYWRNVYNAFSSSQALATLEWGQSTRIDIFLALLMFRVQFSAWPANLDFSMHGALYHVMARDNGGDAVFVTDDDRKVFLHRLG